MLENIQKIKHERKKYENKNKCTLLSSHNFKRFKLKKSEEKLCVKLEEMY